MLPLYFPAVIRDTCSGWMPLISGGDCSGEGHPTPSATYRLPKGYFLALPNSVLDQDSAVQFAFVCVNSRLPGGFGLPIGFLTFGRMEPHFLI